MLSDARGKATAVTRAGRENSETVAKQKQLSLDSKRSTDALSRYIYIYNWASGSEPT